MASGSERKPKGEKTTISSSTPCKQEKRQKEEGIEEICKGVVTHRRKMD